MEPNYHMIDYIHESAGALERTLAVNEAAVCELKDKIRKEGYKKVVISGLGSSYTAAMMAYPLYRYHSALPVHVLPSTDLGLYGDRLLDSETIAVFVSRSGERNWVVDAMLDARERGAYCVSMTGTLDSLLAEKADKALVTQEGPEITFPKTKSVSCCAGLLMRIALALASPDDMEADSRLQELRGMPEKMESVIASVEPGLKEMVPWIGTHSTLLVCGTGSNYGVALEAGVKIQESSYVNTHADDTGDLLHGPLGPLAEDWLVVPLITPYDMNLSRELLDLAAELGGHMLAVHSAGVELPEHCSHQLELPEDLDPLLAALGYLPPIQLLAYYLTLERGLNPDKPGFMDAMLQTILPPDRLEPEQRGVQDETDTE